MTSTNSYDYRSADFFAFRTPLLPFEELEAWSRDLAAPQTAPGESLATALAADRKRLRCRLERLLARPEIREALFLASPTLEAGLKAWRRDPDGKKGQRAEQTLVRYFYRMASRATPFGLFAGCSLGSVGEHTRLGLTARDAYQRHTRLDMDYLFSLCEDLGRDPDLRRCLHYRPNSSLYLAAGRLRYIEARQQGQSRSHHLVAVDAEDYLEEVLHRAVDGATVAELAENLAEREDVPVDEAEDFISELIDSQILISSLSPPVTGQEPTQDLLEQLGRHAVTQPAAKCLAETASRLQAFDGAGLGNDPADYRTLARRLEALPTPVGLARLLQVDMIKPTTEATLDRAALAEIERGVDLLRCLAGPRATSSLDAFCDDFTARYDGRSQVPLVEVLDEEVGLGFESGGGLSASGSPLLDGLVFPQQAGLAQTSWGAREALLLDKLLAARADGASEIDISAEDLERFPPTDKLPPIPEAFHVMATVVAASDQTLDRGDSRVFLRHVGGPSGANLLGRFCHADRALSSKVMEHLRSEEEHDPEAIFAEVVHLPQGRVGNVLLRPVLRSHEIPFLGRSGADPECQIPITDLLVSVERRTVTLHSRRLGRRVIPRLTSAHNFTHRALGIYRFLSSLQAHGYLRGIRWHWGPFEAAAFLPRVTSGRLVLARAQWLVPRQEIHLLADGSAAQRFDAVQRWRARRRLPRWVVLADGDNELLVDLDTVLSIETFLAVIKRRQQLVLMELFPSPEELCARGPEGRFVHELVVPFERHRRRSPTTTEVDPRAVDRQRPERPATDGSRRTFLPGSEWLYAKLYTGMSTADQVLTDVVGPLTRRLMANGAIDRWFFLRYADPHFHLRLRLHGDAQRLASEVLPSLEKAVAPLLDDGRIWQLQLDTYVRELERYGVGDGIALAERIFSIDSDAVLSILESFDSDGDGDGDGNSGGDADSRWLLAARGIDRWFADLGYPLEHKLELLESLRSSYAREFGGDAGLRKQLASRLRRERHRLEEALQPIYDANHPLAAGYRALEQRSRRLAPVVSELSVAEEHGRIEVPRHRLAGSFVHMFTNRLMRAEGRAHELVLYDFLCRHARSQVARERSDRQRVASPHDRAARERRRAE